LDRPPSVVEAPYDPDATHEGAPHVDPEMTDGIFAAPGPGDLVDDFDDLDATDPREMRALRPAMLPAKQPAKPARVPTRKPAPSASESTGPDRPPSAYHDLESLERSYASAIDPDLITAALRRSRGNVSAAARYLGR